MKRVGSTYLGKKKVCFPCFLLGAKAEVNVIPEDVVGDGGWGMVRVQIELGRV